MQRNKEFEAILVKKKNLALLVFGSIQVKDMKRFFRYVRSLFQL